jgi:hypothetical protein
MKPVRFILTLLLKVKESLPKNGDWIFVTESAPADVQIDVAEPYKSPESVLARLSKDAEPEAVKLIYERAKAYESFVEGTANRVYDKSKVLFGAASFASTVLLALGSTLLPPLLASAWWLIAIGAVLSTLILVHLSRSLMIAAKIMVREVIIRESPEEIIDLGAKKDSEVLRELAARTLSYSIQTNEMGRQRVNRLMIAQHSFRYALGFFITLSVLSSLVHLGEGIKEPKIGALVKEISALGSDQSRLDAKLSSLEHEQVLIKRELRGYIDLRKTELEMLRELATQLRSRQVNRQPTSDSVAEKRP